MITVGSTVRYIKEDTEVIKATGWYPPVGTLGTVKKVGETDKTYWVKWDEGTSGDSIWWCDFPDVEEVTSFDDLTPSWYIYTDDEGIAHNITYGPMEANEFFTDVSRRICFDDCSGETVHKIYYKGKEVNYVGWQPGMKYEYKDLDGNTVWVGVFEHWDH